jgi:hypothetical protein
MKKFLLFFILYTGIINAQIIFIPDGDLRTKLLSSSPTNPVATDINGIGIVLDRNNDKEFEVKEVIDINSLNISSSLVSDITGLEKFPNLQNLDCSNNDFTTLDLSKFLLLSTFNCNNNVALNQLFIKNGRIKNFTNSSFSGCPNLVYICVDKFDISAARLAADSNNYLNCVVNSNCSFTPGGIYGTVKGFIRLDTNNDGCNDKDLVFKNFKIKTTEINSKGIEYKKTIFTNNLGEYTLNTNDTNIATGYDQNSFVDLAPTFENPDYFSSNPLSNIVNFASGNNQTQSFCISTNLPNNDLEIVISPLIDARPGFEAKYQLVFKNKGNQESSGDVSLTFNNNKMTYVTAVPGVVAQTTNILTWDFKNLLPFETRTIDITFNIDSTVIVGDMLKFSTKIVSATPDNFPKDNSFAYVQKAVNSLSQNTITCLQGETIANTDDYLHYKINFENIIDEKIKNVVIENLIDSKKFDIETLQILKSSYDVEVSLIENTLNFIYQSISLKPATGNPKSGGGSGTILLKVKPKDPINNGDILSNNANISFDYYAPVGINTATTYLNSTLSVKNLIKDSSINISPNPTKNFVNINANTIIQSIELFDRQGRILQIKYQDKNNTNLDLSTRLNGIYYIKITTVNGFKIEKIIKN